MTNVLVTNHLIQLSMSSSVFIQTPLKKLNHAAAHSATQHAELIDMSMSFKSLDQEIK